MASLQKILVIGSVWPEPASSAAGARMLEMLELFRAQSWEVVFASAASLSSHRAPLASLGVQEKVIELNADSFDDFVRALEPDMVVFDRFYTEEQFGWRVEKSCPHALRVLDTVDLHCLRDGREQMLKKNRAAAKEQEYMLDLVSQTSIQTLFHALAKDDVAQREIAAIYRCDLSLIASEFEIELLRTGFSVPASLLHHCKLMRVRACAERPAFETRAHFISIGNFRHAPNWDAVLCLKQSIWPNIRQALPQAELHLVGAYPPPKATALHAPAQGFLVQGWAENAHQVMAHARVCLAPLRFGAGVKGKLADAMVCGTPSVTTSIGAESMHGEMAWGGAIADDNANFVRAAIDLFQNEDKWREAQQRGDAIIAQRWQAEVMGRALLSALDSARQQQQEKRLNNFTGAMLRHHQHRSNQYFSQWIALKNASAR
ncbi:MAG: glycosyltransferase family 4 protein [Burkholderiaceae bacterium]|nr:glycosyltransferase family 4 protein [Burkholderiaceae bacterium]